MARRDPFGGLVAVPPPPPAAPIEMPVYTPRPRAVSGAAGAGGGGNIITVTTRGGRRFQVAAEHADKFRGLVEELEDRGYPINSIGGFANRNIAGTNTPSQHSFGNSIDINPGENPVGGRGNLPDDIGDIAARHGLGWGGNWKSKKDPMHFSASPHEGAPGAPAPPRAAPAAAPLDDPFAKYGRSPTAPAAPLDDPFAKYGPRTQAERQLAAETPQQRKVRQRAAREVGVLNDVGNIVDRIAGQPAGTFAAGLQAETKGYMGLAGRGITSVIPKAMQATRGLTSAVGAAMGQDPRLTMTPEMRKAAGLPASPLKQAPDIRFAPPPVVERMEKRAAANRPPPHPTSTAENVIGSVAAMAPAAQFAPVVAAGMGAASMEDRAKAKGIDTTYLPPAVANAALFNATVQGTGTAIPVAGPFEKFVPAVQNKVLQLLAQHGINITGGALEEGLSQIAENATARATIDPNAKLGEGVGEEAAAGGILGFVFSLFGKSHARQHQALDQALAQGPPAPGQGPPQLGPPVPGQGPPRPGYGPPTAEGVGPRGIEPRGVPTLIPPPLVPPRLIPKKEATARVAPGSPQDVANKTGATITVKGKRYTPQGPVAPPASVLPPTSALDEFMAATAPPEPYGPPPPPYGPPLPPQGASPEVAAAAPQGRDLDELSDALHREASKVEDDDLRFALSFAGGSASVLSPSTMTAGITHAPRPSSAIQTIQIARQLGRQDIVDVILHRARKSVEARRQMIADHVHDPDAPHMEDYLDKKLVEDEHALWMIEREAAKPPQAPAAPQAAAPESFAPPPDAVAPPPAAAPPAVPGGRFSDEAAAAAAERARQRFAAKSGKPVHVPPTAAGVPAPEGPYAPPAPAAAARPPRLRIRAPLVLPEEYEAARVEHRASHDDMDRAIADVEQVHKRAPPLRSLFQAIRELGGFKLNDPHTGEALAGPDVQAALTDVKMPNLVDNTHGKTPQVIAEKLAENGWFGHHDPTLEYDDAMMNALATEAMAGKRYFHPESGRAEVSADRARIDYDMHRAGVDPGESRAVQAAKLASWRGLTSRANALGIPIHSEATYDELLGDVVEREAIQAEPSALDEHEVDVHGLLTQEDQAALDAEHDALYRAGSFPQPGDPGLHREAPEGYQPDFGPAEETADRFADAEGDRGAPPGARPPGPVEPYGPPEPPPSTWTPEREARFQRERGSRTVFGQREAPLYGPPQAATRPPRRRPGEPFGRREPPLQGPPEGAMPAREPPTPPDITGGGRKALFDKFMADLKSSSPNLRPAANTREAIRNRIEAINSRIRLEAIDRIRAAHPAIRDQLLHPDVGQWPALRQAEYRRLVTAGRKAHQAELDALETQLAQQPEPTPEKYGPPEPYGPPKPPEKYGPPEPYGPPKPKPGKGPPQMVEAIRKMVGEAFDTGAARARPKQGPPDIGIRARALHRMAAQERERMRPLPRRPEAPPSRLPRKAAERAAVRERQQRQAERSRNLTQRQLAAATDPRELAALRAKLARQTAVLEAQPKAPRAPRPKAAPKTALPPRVWPKAPPEKYGPPQFVGPPPPPRRPTPLPQRAAERGAARERQRREATKARALTQRQLAHAKSAVEVEALQAKLRRQEAALGVAPTTPPRKPPKYGPPEPYGPPKPPPKPDRGPPARAVDKTAARERQREEAEDARKVTERHIERIEQQINKVALANTKAKNRHPRDSIQHPGSTAWRKSDETVYQHEQAIERAKRQRELDALNAKLARQNQALGGPKRAAPIGEAEPAKRNFRSQLESGDSATSDTGAHYSLKQGPGGGGWTLTVSGAPGDTSQVTWAKREDAVNSAVDDAFPGPTNEDQVKHLLRRMSRAQHGLQTLLGEVMDRAGKRTRAEFRGMKWESIVNDPRYGPFHMRYHREESAKVQPQADALLDAWRVNQEKLAKLWAEYERAHPEQKGKLPTAAPRYGFSRSQEGKPEPTPPPAEPGPGHNQPPAAYDFETTFPPEIENADRQSHYVYGDAEEQAAFHQAVADQLLGHLRGEKIFTEEADNPKPGVKKARIAEYRALVERERRSYETKLNEYEDSFGREAREAFQARIEREHAERSKPREPPKVGREPSKAEIEAGVPPDDRISTPITERIQGPKGGFAKDGTFMAVSQGGDGLWRADVQVSTPTSQTGPHISGSRRGFATRQEAVDAAADEARDEADRHLDSPGSGENSTTKAYKRIKTWLDKTFPTTPERDALRQADVLDGLARSYDDHTHRGAGDYTKAAADFRERADKLREPFENGFTTLARRRLTDTRNAISNLKAQITREAIKHARARMAPDAAALKWSEDVNFQWGIADNEAFRRFRAAEERRRKKDMDALEAQAKAQAEAVEASKKRTVMPKADVSPPSDVRADDPPEVAAARREYKALQDQIYALQMGIEANARKKSKEGGGPVQRLAHAERTRRKKEIEALYKKYNDTAKIFHAHDEARTKALVGKAPTRITQAEAAAGVPPEPAKPPTTETVKLAGETVKQAVIPGTEGSAVQASKARGPTMKARVPQKEPGGLFAPRPEAPPPDLFAPPTTKAEAPPKKPMTPEELLAPAPGHWEERIKTLSRLVEENQRELARPKLRRVERLGAQLRLEQFSRDLRYAEDQLGIEDNRRYAAEKAARKAAGIHDPEIGETVHWESRGVARQGVVKMKYDQGWVVEQPNGGIESYVLGKEMKPGPHPDPDRVMVQKGGGTTESASGIRTTTLPENVPMVVDTPQDELAPTPRRSGQTWEEYANLHRALLKDANDFIEGEGPNIDRGDREVAEKQRAQAEANIAEAERQIGLEAVDKPVGVKSGRFSDEAAKAAAERIKKKLGPGTLRSGVDPEIISDGFIVAGNYLISRTRSFAAYAKHMLETLGEDIRPYLRMIYNEVRDEEEFDAHQADFTPHAQITREAIANAGKEDVSDQRPNLEPGGPDAGPPNANRPPPVSPGSGGAGGRPGGAGAGAGGAGGGAEGEGGAPDRGSVVVGTPGPGGLRGGGATLAGGNSQRGEPGGSGDPRDQGVSPDRIPRPEAENPPGEAPPGVDPGDVDPGERADTAPPAPNAPDVPKDIADELPGLYPEQQADVAFAEERFKHGHGVLFTNGTGTGKTFTGAGIMKRFISRGQDNILLVAPSTDILKHWIAEAKEHVGVDIKMLEDTLDNGKSGPVGTTYNNLEQNDSLAKRQWDLVVADESHSLMSSAEAEETGRLANFRAVTNHPDGLRTRAEMHFPTEMARIRSLNAAHKKAKGFRARQNEIQAQLEQAHDALRAKTAPLLERLRAEKRSKVVFLSATPFAYDKTLDYAHSYLFDYAAERGGAGGASRSGKNAFLMQHFGYRWRYGKLTRPENPGLSGAFEQAFHEKLVRDKVLSNRVREIEGDYDRKFILAAGGVGAQIDRAFAAVNKQENKTYPWWDVMRSAEKRFDYLARVRMLEAIKAEDAIPIIKQHLALGRKVVVFHDFNKGGGDSPFALTEAERIDRGDEADAYRELHARFLAEHPFVEELNAKIKGLKSPIETLSKAFPDAMIYNGDTSKTNKAAYIARFNKDHSGGDLIVVQSQAGNAGISLHDTTGVHQRVIINLGSPGRPTLAIQEEGRIRRLGMKTNAIFRYMTTGTDWERHAFASRIATRAQTVENLALGPKARTLNRSFIRAYEDADEYPPGHEGEGTGGKEEDHNDDAPMSPFEQAIMHYAMEQRRSGRRDQREGIDYFATPEPLGLKMVQWADVKTGEHMLEPSAGHGAIARYMPEDTNRTLIEPVNTLATRAMLASPGAHVKNEQFEDLHLANKYHAIVMNPPFGFGGKTAMEHIAKAAKHLRNGGRIVAIIPDGPAMDKRFEEWKQSAEAKSIHEVGGVHLPDVAFEKAGTKVRTRVVILEKQTDREVASKIAYPRFQMLNSDSINGLFRDIEEIQFPPRREPITQDEAPPPEGVVAAAAAPAEAAARAPAEFKLGETRNQKEGFPVWVATFTKRAPTAEYQRILMIATKHGGWYSKFDQNGAIPGFQFRSPEARQAFLNEAGGHLDVQQEAVTRRGFLAGGAAIGALAPTDAVARITRTPLPAGTLDQMARSGDPMDAIKWIARNSKNAAYRELAAKLERSGLGKASLQVVPGAEAGGALEGASGATARQWESSAIYLRDEPGTRFHGLTEETVLHESVHAWISSRFRSLATYLPHNRELLKTAARHADPAIDHFVGLWRQVSDMLKERHPDLVEGEKAEAWAQQLQSTPDELLTRTLTDADAQAWLKTHDMKGGEIKKPGNSIWDKIIGAIKRALGIRPKNAAFDELLGAAHSILNSGAHDAPDFSFAQAVELHELQNDLGRDQERTSRIQQNRTEAERRAGVPDRRAAPRPLEPVPFSEGLQEPAGPAGLAGTPPGGGGGGRPPGGTGGGGRPPAGPPGKPPIPASGFGRARAKFAGYGRGVGGLAGEAWRGAGEVAGDVMREKFTGSLRNRAKQAQTKILGVAVDSAASKLKTYAGDVMPEEFAGAVRQARMLVSPMAVGATDQARAAVKTYASAWRGIADEANRLDDALVENFATEQLEDMWKHSDEHSVMEQGGHEPGPKEGKNKLAPDERRVVEALQQDANKTFALARDVGVHNIESSLPSYVPRFVLRMVEGSIKTMFGVEGGREGATMRGVIRSNMEVEPGHQLITTTSNLRRRKYRTAAGTEAAAQKLDPGAFVVKNIRTLALSTAKLKQAIAGRRLLNHIERLSNEAGKAMVVRADTNPDAKQYFTINHPSFRTTTLAGWRTNEKTGKVEPIKDQNGDVVFKQQPVWVHKDLEGPLKSVFQSPSGHVYNALMTLKSKVMSVIMYTPANHNLTIFGRAIAAAPGQVLSLNVYRKGFKAKNNSATRKEALKAGIVPAGRGAGGIQDITGIARGPEIEPGQSWTAKILSYVPDLFSEKAGHWTKRMVDKAGHVWHQRMLWDQIENLQFGLYEHMRDGMIKSGMKPRAAQLVAAHYANRYAGVMPIEAMSKTARQMSNLLWFSRSYTLGNLAAFKDMVAGLPPDVQAQIKTEMGDDVLAHAQSVARRKAISMFVIDLMAQKLGVIITAAAIAGITALGGNMILQWPWENEEGMTERAYIGSDSAGTAMYVRPPTGKSVEDLQNWRNAPIETLNKKLNPLPTKFAFDVLANKDAFGNPIWKKHEKGLAGAARNLGRVARYGVGGVVGGPARQIEAAGDAIRGTGNRPANILRAVGPLAGWTVAQGYPGGPARGAVERDRQSRRFDQEEARHDIMKLIRRGETGEARKRMKAVGITDPKEQTRYIKGVLAPSISKRKQRDLYGGGSEEARQRYEEALRLRAIRDARAATARGLLGQGDEAAF